MQSVITMREARAADTPQPDTAPTAEGAPAAPRAAPAAPPAARPLRDGFLPLLLGLLAVLAGFGFQAWSLEQDRRQLQQARAEMQPMLERAARMRQSLDLLAADTQRLADTGHAPARALVDELRRRGITIRTAAAPLPGGASGSGR